jgi:YfiH family protein
VFAFTDTRGPVAVAFTDREGGVSTPPFGTLNLAGASAVGAEVDHVRENLRRVLRAFAGSAEVPVATVHQVHGADVVAVGRHVQPGDGGPPHADGMVSAQAGVTLMVRVADCVPVLLADPEAGVVGALHAGRRGVTAGVVPRGAEALRAQGARRLVAWVGPHVCPACYEVPAEMRDEVCAAIPEARAVTRWGTPAVDLGSAVAAQLRREGAEVVMTGGCTVEDPRLYSYRRDGERAGRMAALVRIRP